MLFSNLNLIEQLQKAVPNSGYVKATPIQAQAIPHILAGKDILGIAQTGTGKTAAFTLPVLQMMFNSNKKTKSPRVLVLAPTRELAAQIGESFQKYGSFTKFKHVVVFGGVGQFAQTDSLARGVEIVVATPGRLLDLMNQGYVHLDQIEYFILDEADRMLDMGFINDIKKIIVKLPAYKQTLFFSATMSKTVSDLAHTLLKKPIRIEITPEATTVEKIEQGVFFVDKENKDQLLLSILEKEEVTSALVFTRTKHKADKVAFMLEKNDVAADSIHGDKSQFQRTRALDNFKSGKMRVLIATDIAARGIDVSNISHVINYELPIEPESYVHRIGRTGRAGAKGIAYSFCCADERDYLRVIEKVIKQQIPVLKHQNHSDFAQNATGADAKPLPKSAFHRRGSSSGFNRNGSAGNPDKAYSTHSYNRNFNTKKRRY